MKSPGIHRRLHQPLTVLLLHTSILDCLVEAVVCSFHVLFGTSILPLWHSVVFSP